MLRQKDPDTAAQARVTRHSVDQALSHSGTFSHHPSWDPSSRTLWWASMQSVWQEGWESKVPTSRVNYELLAAVELGKALSDGSVDL
ncbi:unnamed protein product [Taenia asiatica]|uniref:RES domain-containing protein n=1 Tax=Taenia asiatica TaxID=60517 RepID=A0A0R3WGB1_TAEAS|nr:unnamed protein product [Taenia asiatica]